MADPTAAEWLAAWSTFGGAIATASAFWVAALAFKLQARDKHRAQARAVTVTLERYLDKTTKMPMATVHVANYSPMPLYSVRAGLVDEGEPPTPFQYALTLPPGDQIVLDLRYRGDVDAYADFTDSSGTRWRRNLRGDLEDRSAPIPWRRRAVNLAKALGQGRRS